MGAVSRVKKDNPLLYDLHFLELGGPGEELFVGVLVAQHAALRVDLLRLLLVAPVHLQLVLPVPVPPVNQSINQINQSTKQPTSW